MLWHWRCLRVDVDFGSRLGRTPPKLAASLLKQRVATLNPCGPNLWFHACMEAQIYALMYTCKHEADRVGNHVKAAKIALS